MIEYTDNQLHIDGVAAVEIARDYGTPVYVYSGEQITANCQAYLRYRPSVPTSLHYAVKANNHPEILRLIEHQGFGFDVVSAGELTRCLEIGADPASIVFSGVGKSVSEITLALDSGIGCINVESFAELERIEQIAQSKNMQAPVAIRVNPHVDARTHPGISTALQTSKFGIADEYAIEACSRAFGSCSIDFKGIVCHIGSQIETLEPYDQACDSMVSLYDRLVRQSIPVEHTGLGGGIGIAYQGQDIPTPEDLFRLVESRLAARKVRLSLEPGRSIVANAGVVITAVEYLKPGAVNFAIVDAAMNDLPRPAIYGAWHQIDQVDKNIQTDKRSYTIVGPVCESTDTLGSDRNLAINQGDLLAVFDTGAYTRVMANNYNLRPLAPGILVNRGKVQPVETRQDLSMLLKTGNAHDD